jgi:hypothetical protein
VDDENDNEEDGEDSNKLGPEVGGPLSSQPSGRRAQKKMKRETRRGSRHLRQPTSKAPSKAPSKASSKAPSAKTSRRSSRRASPERSPPRPPLPSQPSTSQGSKEPSVPQRPSQQFRQGWLSEQVIPIHLLLLLLFISSLLHSARRFDLLQLRLKALESDKRAHDWVEFIEQNILEGRMTEAAKNACEYPCPMNSFPNYLKEISFTRLCEC